MNKSKKQLIPFTPLLIFAVVCLIATPSAVSSEPSYNGRPLSEWLLVLEEGRTLSGERVEASDAQNAVRQIGTNGIPTLIDLLSVYDERSAKRVLSKLHNKELTAWFKHDENPYSSAKDLRKLALSGFSILGTNAECAVPQIAGKLAYSVEAPRALLAVGPKGFSALTNALNGSDDQVRDEVIQALTAESGADSDAIRQLLVTALNDPDKLIRLHTAELLKGKESDVVIPALVTLLSDDSYRWRAANLLAVYGPAAKSAAPNIFSIFTNQPDMMLLPPLRKIDPDIAAQAETFLVNSGPLNEARGGYTETLLKNGMKLVAGGSIHTEIPKVKNRYLSSAELLDPKTGKWTETGEMTTVRYFHMAVLLSNGYVIVMGGENLGADGRLHDLTSAEIYDPATGKWTETGSMNSQHPSERAALQSNGKVLVYEGGVDGYPIHGHELYDTATGTWTVVTNK